jgi:putative DNA primase/helicase
MTTAVGQKARSYDAAVDFLKEFRRNGPWVLTAITPDGPIVTETFTDLAAAEQFVTKYNEGAGLYFSTAVTKGMLRSKAKKADIAAVTYLHVDADPADDETPAQFKARKLAEINSLKDPPTFVIDSGNGLQLLWELTNSVKVTGPDVIADIEARNWGLAEMLGADPSTRNIDRILRLPGTTNFPNAKKRKVGRTTCETKLLEINDAAYPISVFPAQVVSTDTETEDKRDESGSGHGFRYLAERKRRGATFEAACDAILNDTGSAGEWARRVDDRQLRRAWERASSPPISKREYVLVNAADVVPRPLQWLWDGHLLRGAQELQTGVKGLGKSQIQASLVACATTGRPWPNRVRGCAPGNVIMLVLEDTKDQVVVPRLMLAGADLTRVSFLECIKQDDKERTFLLGEDLDLLEQAIRDVGDVCLVSIDPITAVMGNINSSSPTDVRGQLGPLAKLAERTNVAFSTVTHPAKQTTHRALDQFIGSQAFIAAARIGHLCLPETKADAYGAVMPTGRNLYTSVPGNHKRMPSVAYKSEVEDVSRRPLSRAARVQADLAEPITAVRVHWLEEVGITADEALAAALHKSPQMTEQIDSFLETMLAEPQSAEAVYAAGAKRGFSEDQLKRSKKRIKAVSEKKDGFWIWRGAGRT